MSMKTNKYSEKQQIILNELTTKFNFVIVSMINHITEYYGDSDMSKMKLILQKIIADSPNEPISYFLLYVYNNDEYRYNILKQNDKFFLKEDYGSLTNGDTNKMCSIFEFKKLWKDIDDDTKNFIKKSMMALVKISENYILTL